MERMMKDAMIVRNRNKGHLLFGMFGVGCIDTSILVGSRLARSLSSVGVVFAQKSLFDNQTHVT